MATAVKLADCAPLPEELHWAAYFDFDAHPFAHEALLRGTANVVDAVATIKVYTQTHSAKIASAVAESARHALDALEGAAWAHGAGATPGRVFGSATGDHGLVVAEGARCYGDVSLVDGSVIIGEGTVVEPGAILQGPLVLGKNCTIRSGAYLRAPCLIGDGCTLRGELKNVAMMDNSSFPHPSYLGDSICGYLSHFGNQATAANFGIFNGMLARSEQRNVQLVLGELKIDLGTRKLGVILGDYSQVGCNSVTDPATFLRPRTIVYALSRVSAGIYGPNEILKNKPLEHGIIERAPLT